MNKKNLCPPLSTTPTSFKNRQQVRVLERLFLLHERQHPLPQQHHQWI